MTGIGSGMNKDTRGRYVLGLPYERRERSPMWQEQGAQGEQQKRVLGEKG